MVAAHSVIDQSGNVFVTADGLCIRDEDCETEFAWKHVLKYSDIRWVEPDGHYLPEILFFGFFGLICYYPLCTLIKCYWDCGFPLPVPHHWFLWFGAIGWHIIALPGIICPIYCLWRAFHRNLRIILNDGSCIEEPISIKWYNRIRATIISRIIPKPAEA